MSPKGERKQSAAKKGGASPAKKARNARSAVSKQEKPKEGEAVQKSSSARGDAVALLRADHRAVERMFAQYPSASDEEKAQMTQQICQALSIHARLEDELFYPACREHGIDTDLMDEAQVEHDAVAVLIEELMRSEPRAPYHDAMVKVLGEYIQMHVREEEKPGSGIFAKARKPGLDMSGLGQRLQSRKQELEADAQARGIHPPSPRTLGTVPQQDNGESKMARFNQERDEQGRFVSDDDRGYGRSGGEGGRYSRSRDDDGGSRGRSSSGYNDDDRSRYGRGRDDDDRGGSSRSSRSRYDDDDRSSGSRGRSDDDRGHGGWFGDSEGHARAAQRGWETRRDDDDDDRGRSRSSRSGSGSSSRSRYDDDDRSSSRGRSDDDRGHGGWFGDSEGHSRAAQRGWETRRDDDDRSGSRSGRGGR